MYQFAILPLLSALSLSVLVTSAPSPDSLEKRITHTGRGTWFDVGLGACGQTNVNSDFIVAISPQVFGNKNHCGKSVVITANGKTATATVRDKCPGCGKYDVDMSPGLFRHFANLDIGVVKISWHFA